MSLERCANKTVVVASWGGTIKRGGGSGGGGGRGGGGESFAHHFGGAIKFVTVLFGVMQEIKGVLDNSPTPPPGHK